MTLTSRVVAITPLVALLAACGGDSGSEPDPAVATNLLKVAGDGQSGTVGQVLPSAPSVKVTDASSRGVAGVTVTFTITGGGGSIAGATATSDANGVATAGSWTLGTTPGPNSLAATAAGTGIAGNPATFTATAVAGAPRTMSREAGDAQTAIAGTAVAIAPSVKVVDEFGNPLAGISVTFTVTAGGGTITGATPTTGSDGKASLGSWQLGPTAGSNELTASIAATGVTGNPATFTATGTLPAFNPTSSVALGGTHSYSSVNIPAGVTVTASSDLVIHVSGNATIAGSIVGDCRGITIDADSSLNITGDVDNACAVLPSSAAPPMLSLVGRTGYTLGGNGTITSSGDVDVTNDPTLTDADFLRLGTGRDLSPTPARIAGGSASQRVQFLGAPVCIVNSRSFTASPATAKAGTPGGSTGGKGRDGSTWTLRCRGEMQMSNTSVTGQNGGPGGLGSDLNNASGANATGGDGGNGGKLRILSTLEMGLNGNNTFTSGSGGNGGSADATAAPNSGPAQAPSAVARGGKGGNPGLVEVTGKGGIVIAGSLNLNVGDGGDGGSADATGADGADATSSKPAQKGGNATATGGAGGVSPDKKLGSSGSVTGLGNVTVTGGGGGDGGDASADAGEGGDGVLQNKPGADGGNFTANGGTGGNADLRDQNNALVGLGGSGGDITLSDGNGGDGYDDCQSPITSGGRGGNGGDGSGNSGLGGTGATSGSPGSIRVEDAGNGGNGGDGIGPGNGGSKGSSSGIGANGARTDIAPVFSDGTPGSPCPGPSNMTGTVLPPTSDPSGHEPVLNLAGSRNVTVQFGPGSAASISGLIVNSSITLSGTLAGNSLTLSGSGVINTGFGPRNATVTFTGTLTESGISGTMSVVIQGFPLPTVYPVNMP